MSPQRIIMSLFGLKGKYNQLKTLGQQASSKAGKERQIVGPPVVLGRLKGIVTKRLLSTMRWENAPKCSMLQKVKTK